VFAYLDGRWVNIETSEAWEGDPLVDFAGTVELAPKSADCLSTDAEINNVATDALYQARDHGKAMNGAAASVVAAVAPLIEARVRARGDDAAERVQEPSAPRMRRHSDGRFAVEAGYPGEWHVFQPGARVTRWSMDETYVSSEGWREMAPPRVDLAALAADIARNLGTEFPRSRPEMAIGQGLSLSEESGELVCAALSYSVHASQVNGALRRMLGIARRSGSRAELEGELADAFISLFLVAHYAQADPWAAIEAKTAVIFSRGWHAEPAS
jgi:NTP pyrophosphatase (non-canonical NTP hydrolase)